MSMEGGDTFTNDPSDPGGATKYGVSLRFLKDITEGDIDHDGDIDADDVRALSWTTAKYLYEKHFWHPDFELLPVVLASKVFDLRVNMGPVQATKIIQAAINECETICYENVDFHHQSLLIVDGVMGNETLKQLRRDAILPTITHHAARFYFDLADKRPASQKYLLGWLRRTYKVMI
jgi:lysozyme family protein